MSLDEQRLAVCDYGWSLICATHLIANALSYVFGYRTALNEHANFTANTLSKQVFALLIVFSINIYNKRHYR